MKILFEILFENTIREIQLVSLNDKCANSEKKMLFEIMLENTIREMQLVSLKDNCVTSENCIIKYFLKYCIRKYYYNKYYLKHF